VIFNIRNLDRESSWFESAVGSKTSGIDRSSDAARAECGRSKTIRGQIRFLAVRHLVPSKRTRNSYKQEVPMALEKTGLMRRRGEHAFAA
jgi:hypothetical protein